MLVDDDPSTNYLHTRVIKAGACAEHVDVVDNGQAAIDFIRKAAAEKKPFPELILLDINMPVLNGWEFLEAYKRLPDSEKGNSKIIMLTTSMNPDDELLASEYSEVSAYYFKSPLVQINDNESQNRLKDLNKNYSL